MITRYGTKGTKGNYDCLLIPGGSFYDSKAAATKMSGVADEYCGQIKTSYTTPASICSKPVS